MIGGPTFQFNGKFPQTKDEIVWVCWFFYAFGTNQKGIDLFGSNISFITAVEGFAMFYFQHDWFDIPYTPKV